ncbi:MAG: GNAT family N-acetyltransferase [Gammaproteobacteria bacterium]|nr:GNAT family N-acetyltransferase [Gammaproteobacteria bacterium]
MDKKPEFVFYELNPFYEFEKVKSIWLFLLKICPHSFFLSWEWIGAWIKCLPSTQDVRFVYVEDKSGVIFAFFVGIKKGFENSFIYCSRGYLNSIGEDLFDEITIEYNGFLLSPVVTKYNYSKLLSYSVKRWGEFHCPAVGEEWVSSLNSVEPELTVKLIESRSSFYIDLNRVRSNGNSLLPLLSKNKRSQINKSIRNYETDTKLTVELASTQELALDYLAGLEALHQKSWELKGEPGSFSSPFFKSFHDKMITDSFTLNHLHLFKIASGAELIGYIYCFAYDKKVYFYQSGLNYRSGNDFRPGLVCHLMVVNFYAEMGGYESYDFMAGDSAYKKSLSTDCDRLYWIKIRRNKFYFKIEDYLKTVKAYFGRTV